MNSLVSSLRTALRPTATRAIISRAPYSTHPSPSADSGPVASTSSASPSSSSSSSSKSGINALDSVIAGIKNSKKKATSSSSRASPPRPSAADLFASHRGSAHAAASRFLFDSTPSAKSQTPRPATPEETWRHTPAVPYSLPVTTTSARSFAVRDGNVARAYRTLNRVLNDNNVRRELKRQERFETPSNKRVRLNSERHRRRFKVAVGKSVSLALRTKDL
ncbi:hypothetical protein JCM3775_003035 [Rhodotorula graminis]|uniref:Ribosomal protein S21 n=1 Tax=Rhodotorula graminis (strain WP1) TaxID=578459 RepID=A0A194S7N4_RHOGW|nr:uncharacterized protein RHOBADRAFT_42946 [Rhodotorula graminis WP1]KPV76602.1 hypothetical protein RHOBADRAFT_42946 [Rhodotorula graminis WP1]